MRLLLLLCIMSLFLFSSCVCSGANDHRVLALTFDDGPGFYTNSFLDVLSEKNVSATFFVQGYRVQAQPLLVQRIVDDGHALGVHTWNHSLSFFASSKSFSDEFFHVQSTLPVQSFLYRPAYGIPSFASLFFAQKHNISVILWSVNSVDYKARSSAEIVSRVVSRVRPGSIVLLHDGIDNSVLTLEALPIIIDRLREKGFEFVTVSELLSNE